MLLLILDCINLIRRPGKDRVIYNHVMINNTTELKEGVLLNRTVKYLMLMTEYGYFLLILALNSAKSSCSGHSTITPQEGQHGVTIAYLRRL